MSHNFNWTNIPDSSKMREQNGNSLLEYNDKFFFGDENNGNQHDDYICFDENDDKFINVSLDEINSLNIIINDNECSNTLIESICEQLDKDGIQFSFSRRENNFSSANSVIVTLDQQYVSGPRVSVIGPYCNERNDNSDALALAMYTSFKTKGIDMDGICCGKRGYRQDDYGISTRVPTPTEDAIPIDSNISFVTLALGTNIPTVEDIAMAIEEGLARYITFISTLNNSDLIRRAKPGDTVETLAESFGSTAFEISNLNNIDTAIPSDEAIINPVQYNFAAFNQGIPVNIDKMSKNQNRQYK